jgi:hypothetical protein
MYLAAARDDSHRQVTIAAKPSWRSVAETDRLFVHVDRAQFECIND